MASKKYNEAVKNILLAIDIAIDVFQKYPPEEFEKHHIEHTVNVYREFKVGRIEAEPHFQNMASLKYDIEAVFTYFQEASGETVNQFWQEIAASNLPYQRENRMEKILLSGKIRNLQEYDYVIDTIIPFHQLGLINSEDVEKLNLFLKEFENKLKRTRRT